MCTSTHDKSSKFLNFGNENQFQYQIFLTPVPRLFSGTKFCRYRFRDFFPVPNFSDTGSETFFQYQIFLILVLGLLSCTNLFGYHPKIKKILVPGIPGTGTSHSGSEPLDSSLQSPSPLLLVEVPNVNKSLSIQYFINQYLSKFSCQY